MNHTEYTVLGILLPFLGTTIGAAMVFLLRRELRAGVQKLLIGFASGVMIAASVWSLLIPAIEMEEERGGIAWIPAVVGFLIGIVFLLFLDRFAAKLELSGESRDMEAEVVEAAGKPDNKTAAVVDGSPEKSGEISPLRKNAMLIIAVTLHNLPEGMAVGVVFAGFLAGSGDVTLGGAMALALGIAIQNFPEGAIISMPLHAQGRGKTRAFWYGVLSGAVEPVFGALTVLCAGLVIPAMPYLLSFAAGAMVYVVVEELLPDPFADKNAHIGAIFFAVGFTVMMALDVALG